MRNQSDRATLVRATFDAHVDLLFVTSKNEKSLDLPLSPQDTEQVRIAFHRHMERHWSEWQQETRNDSDDRLHSMLEDFHDRLDSLGMLEWQEREDRSDERVRPKMSLADLRREVEQDTRAAEGERLERTRQEKILGPREEPKAKGRDCDMER